MGKGGGGQSTNTVQKADPWIGIQPALSQLYNDSVQNYQGGGPSYYPGSTLAPSNGLQDHALLRGWDTADTNINQLQSVISQLQKTASGSNPNDNPANAGLTYLSQGQGLNQNYANPYLDKTARGDYLSPDSNPYLKGMFNDAASGVTDQFRNAIAPGLASQFSAAGRGGSGAAGSAFDNASGTLGRTLNNLSSNIYGGAYESERGRQMTAQGLLSGNYNAAAQQQFGALQELRGQYNTSNQMQQQAAQMLPGLQAAQQNNLSQLLGIGEYRQNQNQQQINDDRSRWDYNQNKPVMNLQMLNQLLQGGMALNGSSSQSTGSGPARNPFTGAIGGAMAGSALSSGMGSLLGGGAGAAAGGAAGGAAAGSSVMPGWGTIIGAVLGGLFG